MSNYVEAVKRYALAHYDEKSWSYVVEAWSDVEIASQIAGSTNSLMAIRMMSEWVIMHHEYAEDIRNSWNPGLETTGLDLLGF